MWSNDGLGNYMFIPKGSMSATCGMHPKPTMSYLKYLGMELFSNEKDFKDWYYHKNYWYGDTSPSEVNMQEAIDRLLRAIHGVYI